METIEQPVTTGGSCAQVSNGGAPYGWRNGKYKHGMKGSPEWKAWVNARRRCADPNHPDWKNYGGRGITMCAAWRASFAAFRVVA